MHVDRRVFLSTVTAMAARAQAQPRKLGIPGPFRGRTAKRVVR